MKILFLKQEPVFKLIGELWQQQILSSLLSWDLPGSQG